MRKDTGQVYRTSFLNAKGMFQVFCSKRAGPSPAKLWMLLFWPCLQKAFLSTWFLDVLLQAAASTSEALTQGLISQLAVTSKQPLSITLGQLDSHTFPLHRFCQQERKKTHGCRRAHLWSTEVKGTDHQNIQTTQQALPPMLSSCSPEDPISPPIFFPST